MTHAASTNPGIYNAVQTVIDVTDDNSDQIRNELLERQRIAEVMLRFGRGLDLHDWDMYARTLDDDFEIDLTEVNGSPPSRSNPADWAKFAKGALQRLIVHHQYSNFAIDISGDEADGVFYFIARHRLQEPQNGNFYTQYGWYSNSYCKTTNGWKLAGSNPRSSGARVTPP